MNYIKNYEERYTNNGSKVIFAHMCNTIQSAEWGLKTGANGLEMDLRFNPNTNIPTEFRHSTVGLSDVCDCSVGQENRDNVCKYLNNPIKGKGHHTCISSENAVKMLNHLATKYTLAVLYIDSKLDKDDAPKNLTEAGKNVINLIEKELFLKGYKGQVIISAGDLTYANYIKSAVEASKKTENPEKYYFTYDGGSSNVNIFPSSGKAKKNFRNSVQGLINTGTKNRVYSDGIAGLLPGTFYDEMSLAAYNKKVGVIASSGVWTVDNPDTIRKYLNFGVDAIVTNVPAVALAIIKERGLTLAKPGEALKPATSDKIITELPPGEICESNSNCGNSSCGRDTAADGALKNCCKSGKFGTYAFYDYCYGMPDNSVCWSDAMCAGGYCRGNLNGLRKGVCGKLEVGKSCNIDANCKNGNCARESANSGAPKVCCNSGKSGRWAGFDYCYLMKNGTTCWSDAMCASGNCKGNMYGLRRGTCK